MQSWSDSIRVWMQPKAIVMLFFGFSAGIPILLIFSTLSVWLREAGVERSAVTFFSWAALGYSFKFLWAPLMDLLPLPVLTGMLGRRRAWLVIAQGCVVLAILWMASIDPAENIHNLSMMAMAAVLLGFSSASQDVVIDAYRIESADVNFQALLSSMYIAGYRTGMLVAGAGSLFLADYLGSGTAGYTYQSWRTTYCVMAGMMGVGIITTLMSSEPEEGARNLQKRYTNSDYGRFLLVFFLVMLVFAFTFFHSGNLIGYIEQVLPPGLGIEGSLGSFVFEAMRFCVAGACAFLVVSLSVRSGLVNREMARGAYYEPVRDFFVRYGGKTAGLMLALIGFYRLSDIVLGVVSNVFYLDMGFSKTVIAGITKTFGLGMTLAGGFLGGLLTIRFGIQKILFLGALLSAATNLLFMLLAGAGGNVALLTMVIGADNLSAGIATTAFVAFLSGLTNMSFTAVQYAIFSSMMTLFPKVIGGYSGTMVSGLGYENFFLITALMGLPVLVLIVMVQALTKKG